MISFKQKKSGDDGFPRKVSIRELTDQNDIAQRLAESFVPKYAGPNFNASMNSLGDYVFEWYEDNWGKKSAIQVNGFRDLMAKDPELAVDLALIFARQETGIATDKAAEPDVTQKLNNLRIILA